MIRPAATVFGGSKSARTMRSLEASATRHRRLRSGRVQGVPYSAHIRSVCKLQEFLCRRLATCAIFFFVDSAAAALDFCRCAICFCRFLPLLRISFYFCRCCSVRRLRFMLPLCGALLLRAAFGSCFCERTRFASWHLRCCSAISASAAATVALLLHFCRTSVALLLHFCCSRGFFVCSCFCVFYAGPAASSFILRLRCYSAASLLFCGFFTDCAAFSLILRLLH